MPSLFEEKKSTRGAAERRGNKMSILNRKDIIMLVFFNSKRGNKMSILSRKEVLI